MSDIFDYNESEAEIILEDNLVTKDEDINLTAKDPTMSKILLGAGWDLNAFDADALDLDVSLFLLDKDDMTRVDEDFVFYNNMSVLDGGVDHSGDSRTGAGDGDDEAIVLDLHKIPFDIVRIPIVISIYQGYEKEQNMGMVRNSYLRIVNHANAHEILRFKLDKELIDRPETAVICGELRREGPKWHFQAKIEFLAGGLGAFATRYGIIVQE